MLGYLYILQSLKNNTYYIGASNNIQRRLNEHNRGNTTSTRKCRPWKLVYTEEFRTVKEAKQRERQIKRWKNRKAIERLIKTRQD